MTSRASPLVDLVVFVFAETDKAVLVGEDEADKSTAVWLAKSQIEIAEKAVVRGTLWHDLSLPEWLAIDKGLV